MKEHVYLNGRNVPVEKACVSVFDRGLTYGDGLYETMKAIDGRPLFLKEHIARLLQGARELRMEVPLLKPFIDELKAGAIETLLGRNRLNEGEAYVKLMVTRGPDRASHLPTKGVLPTTVIVTKKIETATLSRLREKGVAAIAVADISPALPGVKSLNYLSSVLARMQAGKAGAFEAIFTRDGFVTEGSSSNVFAVKNGVITTPPLEHGPSGGVLPGVIRGEVKRLAARNRIPFSEATVPLNALEAADEAFLTNSIIEAVPLIKIGKAKIGNGKPGPVTRLFQTLLTPSGQGL